MPLGPISPKSPIEPFSPFGPGGPSSPIIKLKIIFKYVCKNNYFIFSNNLEYVFYYH